MVTATTELISAGRLTHLQRLEAEAIQIMREAVSESEQPGDALLDRQGQLGHAAPGDEGVLPVEAAVPAGPRRHDVQVPARCTSSATTRPPSSASTCIVHQNPECVEKGINPFDHGSAVHTDMWKTEGLKQVIDANKFDLVLRRRPPRRGEVARQGAHLLDPLGRSTSGTRSASGPSCGRSTTPGAATARPCACSRSRTGPSSTCGSTSTSRRSRSCRSTTRRPARSSTATAR